MGEGTEKKKIPRGESMRHVDPGCTCSALPLRRRHRRSPFGRTPLMIVFMHTYPDFTLVLCFAPSLHSIASVSFRLPCLLPSCLSRNLAAANHKQYTIWPTWPEMIRLMHSSTGNRSFFLAQKGWVALAIG